MSRRFIVSAVLWYRFLAGFDSSHVSRMLSRILVWRFLHGLSMLFIPCYVNQRRRELKLQYYVPILRSMHGMVFVINDYDKANCGPNGVTEKKGRC